MAAAASQHTAEVYVQPLSLTELNVTISLPTNSLVKKKKEINLF